MIKIFIAFGVAGVLLKLIRDWMQGPKCTSTRRLDGKTVVITDMKKGSRMVFRPWDDQTGLSDRADPSNMTSIKKEPLDDLSSVTDPLISDHSSPISGYSMLECKSNITDPVIDGHSSPDCKPTVPGPCVSDQSDHTLSGSEQRVASKAASSLAGLDSFSIAYRGIPIQHRPLFREKPLLPSMSDFLRYSSCARAPVMVRHPWHGAGTLHWRNLTMEKKVRPKKFKCEECGAGFSNNGQLKGHIRIHTGERPFSCDHVGCDKSFTRNEELTRHKRIHSGVKPFMCPVPSCGKLFGRKDHLKKHVKTHERPFVPPFTLPAVCGVMPTFPVIFNRPERLPVSVTRNSF